MYMCIYRKTVGNEAVDTSDRYNIYGICVSIPAI